MSSPTDETDTPRMLDFSAQWCGHCKMLTPVVRKLADKWKGKVTVEFIDTDKEKELAVQNSVVALPTFIFMKGGKEVDRLVGAVAPAAIEERLKKLADEQDS